VSGTRMGISAGSNGEKLEPVGFPSGRVLLSTGPRACPDSVQLVVLGGAPFPTCRNDSFLLEGFASRAREDVRLGCRRRPFWQLGSSGVVRGIGPRTDEQAPSVSPRRRLSAAPTGPEGLVADGSRHVRTVPWP